MEMLTFEEADPDHDAPRLRAILNRGMEHKERVGDTSWGDGWNDSEAQWALDRSTTYYIHKDDELVGTIALEWEDKETWGEEVEGDAGYLHRLVIFGEYAGQGLGSQAVDWAAQQVRDHGFSTLRLDAPADNERLCAHYESMGFERVGTRFVPTQGNYTGALFEKKLGLGENATGKAFTPE